MKKYECLFTFALAGVIATLACYFAGILPGGAYRAVYTDTMDQMAAMSALLVRQIRTGGNLFYSMQTSMGQNTALLFAFCAYSPFTLLYLLIPDVYAATMIGMILRIALSAMCFHLFLQYGLHYSKRTVIFFSLCYGLCGFQYEYMLSSNLMDALYLLPIVMLCLLRALDKERFCLLSISYAVTFCVQFYCGFLIGFFSFLFLIIYLVYQEGRSFWKKRMRFLIRYAISVLAAVFMSMLLLAPAISFFMSSVGFNSLSYRELPRFLDILYSMYFGRPTSLMTYIPFLYCGLPVLLLLPVYFMDRAYPQKEKILMGAILVSLFLSLWLDPVYLFLHAFNRPDGFTVRYAFVYVFFMVWLVARYVIGKDGTKQEAKFDKKHYLLYFMLQIGLAVAIILIHDRFGEVADRKGVKFGLWGTVIFLLLWAIYGLGLFLSKRENWKMPIGIVLISVELGLQAYFNGCEQGRTSEVNYVSWDAQMQQFIAQREQADDGKQLYRAHLGNAPFANQSALYGYPGIAQFASSNYSDLYKFMVRMGDAVSAVRYTQVGATDLTDMLLGIRYRGRLTKKEVTPEGAEGPGFEVYKRALPLGFMASGNILNPIQCDGNVFENQNRLLSSLCGRDLQVYRKSEVFAQNCTNTEYYQTEKGYGIRTLSEEEYGEVMFGIPEEGYEHAYAFFQLLPYSDEVTETSLQENIAENIVHYSPDDRKGSGARTESVLGNAVIEMTKDGNAFILLVGDFDKPDREYAYTEQYFCYQDEAVLDEAYQLLASGGWQVNSWRDGYIDAQVNATEEMPVLFVSIPYDKGWEVLVDGKREQISPVALNAFMGVALQSGEHHIVLEYHTPGKIEGRLLAGVGFILLLALLWLEYRGKAAHKEKNKSIDTDVTE